TSKCFRYDPTTNNIIFESKETNPLCPVEVKANKLYEGSREYKGGERDATITYRVAGCDITAELTIPMKVTAQEADSVFAAPDTNELGDVAAAKPLYVLNQTQLGSRDITIDYAPTEASENTSEKQSQLSLYGGSAHALAFRGPGTLTLSDGEETLNEVYYEDTLKVMKAGVGTTGYRKTSCADYKCCSHGWCTRKALKQALKGFQEKATQIAAKTAFRRGGGQPFATLSQGKQFSFATVAQMIQGVDSLLPEYNFTIDQADYEQGNCVNGTPAVFELKASGSNAENLSYSAKVLPLYKFAYTDAQCEEGFEMQSQGPYAGLEYQPLCSFLYGDGNCVARTDESNPLTMDQTSHLNLKVTLCIFPSFEVVSMPLCLLPCTIGWIIYSACHTTCAAEAAKATAAYAAEYEKCIYDDQKCEPRTPSAGGSGEYKKPDDDGKQWKYHKYLSNTLVPKIAAFHIDQDVPYNESTTQDAFEKIGHAFSNIDFTNFDYGEGMATCFSINTNWQWQVQNLVNNVGGQSGFNYENWLNSLLPIIAGHGCACSAKNMWKGLPAYTSKSKDNPKCYGFGDLVSMLGGSKEARGVPWSFSFGTTGNDVFLRFDLGVKGNCKISHPFEKAGWGSSAKGLLKQLALPLGMSLITYLLTDQKDFAITISGNPQMGTDGEPSNAKEETKKQVSSECAEAGCDKEGDTEVTDEKIDAKTGELEAAGCTAGECPESTLDGAAVEETPAPEAETTTEEIGGCASDAECGAGQRCVGGQCISPALG
ncbi:MAG: dickkopf-related protein, partial [Candidatus Micrarchaeota archaeon]